MEPAQNTATIQIVCLSPLPVRFSDLGSLSEASSTSALPTQMLPDPCQKEQLLKTQGHMRHVDLAWFFCVNMRDMQAEHHTLCYHQSDMRGSEPVAEPKVSSIASTTSNNLNPELRMYQKMKARFGSTAITQLDRSLKVNPRNLLHKFVLNRHSENAVESLLPSLEL